MGSVGRGSAGWGSAGQRSVARRSVALAVVALVLAGCPGPDDPEPCAGEGEPVLTLANRGGGTVLADGVQVDVFPPPQGGVFTELDAVIENLGASELEYLRVTIDATDTGEQLAHVRFFGEYIPLQCTEDEVLVVEYLPVGFMESYLLTDLDGVTARVTGTLETTGGEFSTGYDVVLRATDY